MPSRKLSRGGDAFDDDANEQWIKKAAAAKAKYKHPDCEGLVTLAPHEVGVHPRDRDGAGSRWFRVHDLGAEVLYLGCDHDEPQGGCCVGAKSGGDAARTYNEKRVEYEPHFPRVSLALRFGSLEHSHFNYFTRCVDGACPSPCTTLTADGKLPLNVVAARR